MKLLLSLSLYMLPTLYFLGHSNFNKTHNDTFRSPSSYSQESAVKDDKKKPRPPKNKESLENPRKKESIEIISSKIEKKEQDKKNKEEVKKDKDEDKDKKDAKLYTEEEIEELINNAVEKKLTEIDEDENEDCEECQSKKEEITELDKQLKKLYNQFTQISLKREYTSLMLQAEQESSNQNQVQNKNNNQNSSYGLFSSMKQNQNNSRSSSGYQIQNNPNPFEQFSPFLTPRNISAMEYYNLDKYYSSGLSNAYTSPSFGINSYVPYFDQSYSYYPYNNSYQYSLNQQSYQTPDYFINPTQTFNTDMGLKRIPSSFGR